MSFQIWRNRGQFSSKDYKFVCDAAMAGAMEVDLGQAAADKASDPGVRDFGKRMVADHQKAGDELKALVAQKGATVMDTPGKKDEKTAEHLKSLSGTEFDKAYVKQMVDDHKEVVKAFQQAANKSDDQDLKAWAAKTLPTLQSHLAAAQSLQTTVTTASR